MLECTELFLVDGDQVLVAKKKRGFGEGKWVGIGGKVEPGETATEAMIRECEEEIEVTPILFKKVADITAEEIHDNTRKLVHIHAYIVTQWRGNPTETDEMAPSWFNSNELPFDTMWPDSREWMPLVLSGKLVKAHFILNDHNELLDSSLHIVNSFKQEVTA